MRTLITLLLILLTGISPLLAQDATEIIRKMDEKQRGETSKAELTMTIVRPSWQRSISMTTWSKGSDLSLILITAPARDEGSAYLKRDNEIWNWVPTIGRTVKLPPSMMMQSWMGSDFTNDDLIRESSVVKDYTHEITGDSTLLDQSAWEITLIPKPDAPVVWGKVVSWVAKDEYIQLLTRFYDEDGYLINTMRTITLSDFDGRLLASEMEMIPEDEPGNKTILEYKSLEFDIDLNNSFFTVNNMKRLR